METRNFILAKRAATSINRQIINDRNRRNYRLNRFSAKKRKRILSITLYDGRLYAKFETKQAKKRYKIQIECDSLWDKFCSLESLISVEAFQIIERINKIEYLTVS